MAYEVDFLQAGDSNGDAICIRYDLPPGQFGVHVVDGGFVDTGNRIIAHIDTYYQPLASQGIRIAHMVLSHMDDDHAGGLLRGMQHYAVGKDCLGGHLLRKAKQHRQAPTREHGSENDDD